MKDLSLANGIPSRSIAEGATTPDPGYKSIIWSVVSGKYLCWTGTVWIGATSGVKDSRARVSSNSSGVWTKTYPTGAFVNEPAFTVSPISASVSGQIGWKVAKVLSNNAWTVTITFTVVPPSFTIVVGATITTNVAAGTVVFDYTANDSMV